MQIKILQFEQSIHKWYHLDNLQDLEVSVLCLQTGSLEAGDSCPPISFLFLSDTFLKINLTIFSWLPHEFETNSDAKNWRQVMPLSVNLISFLMWKLGEKRTCPLEETDQSTSQTNPMFLNGYSKSNVQHQAYTSWSCRRSSPFLNMILQHPPFAVRNANRNGCNALLNIEDSDGMIPVINRSGARGDRIGCKASMISILWFQKLTCNIHVL